MNIHNFPSFKLGRTTVGGVRRGQWLRLEVDWFLEVNAIPWHQALINFQVKCHSKFNTRPQTDNSELK